MALAHGLAGRGHEVVVVAARRYASLVRDGVGFAGLSVDPVAIAGSAEGRAWLESGALGFVRGFREVVEPLAETLVAEVDAACRKADLVLAPALGAFGRHLHDRYGMPYHILHFQPGHPTTAFPNPLIPARTLGRLGNRASYALVERLGWLVLGGMVNRLRARTLGLGRLRGSPFAADRRDQVPVLCGFSRHVVPRPAGWPDHVRQTGYWTRGGGELGDELTAFLEAGPRPVYVGFGSMVPGDPVRTAEQVRVALRLAGVRAVVQGVPVERTEEVLPVGEVAHEALFARVRAVVHHGGAGTTGAALRAGVPSVVCPFFSDQPFWGLRVAALGAGPPPLPISRLVAGELAARLRAAPLYEEKSQYIGRLLRTEDGVKNAVDLIEES
ncbi:UDP:flavonoid glycosyltransferase YjiC (YdhE family) [Nonomuraea endophytica]|uniref:UDP:flavonoid glycosyltransferase YjiC (YdhE family) n=1 Tax=Nonomuraea endophytica TaxID=714136 RepID=A0A7W8ABR5_9ACTN|nr:UDP:flavonoid glycosyltransferase YjiC (YdhE family) [Nonomuraea endophytica]